MKEILLTVLSIFGIIFNLFAQELITGTYDFQTDPAKKYAIYVPSGYNSDVSSKVILGLHPWNTTKWDAESWAEELSELAEANNFIVICPDGGSDGKIDDPIDTAFTSFLLDEMLNQYNIDEEQIYLVGFSWGAKTTYTYGLNHVEKFAGYMPIGAAVQQSEVADFAALANKKPFYIIHGSQDSPNVRFYPLVELMENSGACVETNLLSGVGHTVEFPNQFAILNEGLQWLISSTCGTINAVDNNNFNQLQQIEISSNVLLRGEKLKIESTEKLVWSIFNGSGTLVLLGTDDEILIDLSSGMYFISINGNSVHKILVK